MWVLTLARCCLLLMLLLLLLTLRQLASQPPARPRATPSFVWAEIPTAKEKHEIRACIAVLLETMVWKRKWKRQCHVCHVAVLYYFVCANYETEIGADVCMLRAHWAMCISAIVRARIPSSCSTKHRRPTQPGHPSVGEQNEYWRWLTMVTAADGKETASSA